MYENQSRHDLEKVHVLQLFLTAPLLMLRMLKFMVQSTQRYLFTPEKASNRHFGSSRYLRRIFIENPDLGNSLNIDPAKLVVSVRALHTIWSRT